MFARDLLPGICQYLAGTAVKFGMNSPEGSANLVTLLHRLVISIRSILVFFTYTLASLEVNLRSTESATVHQQSVGQPAPGVQSLGNACCCYLVLTISRMMSLCGVGCD